MINDVVPVAFKLNATVAKWKQTRLRQASPSPAKNGSFEPFVHKNDHFAKTGSGQT
jgi:hypothetical protein